MKIRFITAIVITIPALSVSAQNETDSTNMADEMKTIHRIEVSAKPSAILHTNDYLNGTNPEKRTMNHAMSYHLKYAFSAAEDSKEAATYPGAYQGLGIAYHEFNPQLGNPISVYLFQGARIAKLSKRVSFNYEWNLGLTFGWNPYDMETNHENISIGSKVTAYIDADFYIKWILSRFLDLNFGMTVTHFSNGNTAMPNYGLNTAGLFLGLAYYVNRKSPDSPPTRIYTSDFERRITYDLVLFGAWRQKATTDGTDIYPLPRKDAVIGFNFNPMYNINPWINAGLSLDGVYDRSANIMDEISYNRPSATKQMALGISARAEFVMPYFTINMGVGKNFINATGDFKGVYEILALKMNFTRRAFLHIGYSLYDLKKPNHLMLGFGFRFGKLSR